MNVTYPTDPDAQDPATLAKRYCFLLSVEAAAAHYGLKLLPELQDEQRRIFKRLQEGGEVIRDAE